MTTDPDRTLADRAATQHGVFTLKDARKAKLTDTQIDDRVARHWVTIHAGVYRAAGAPPTWRGRLLAATLAAGAGSAISHRAAAALYGLPGGQGDLVEVTCLRWKRTTQPGLVVHESRRLQPAEIHVVDGIPTTIPERTVLDLAWHFPRAHFLEIVVQTARRKRLITYESTKQHFDQHARRGLNGVRALREVLDRWDPETCATESEMETLLLQALREHGLPEPVAQYEIRNALGAVVARADVAYPTHRIAIEYDSMQEHSDEFQLARDARRRNALQTLGYAVFSVRHDSLQSGAGELCAQINALMRRTQGELA